MKKKFVIEFKGDLFVMPFGKQSKNFIEFSTGNGKLIKKITENKFLKWDSKKQRYEFTPNIFDSKFAVHDCLRFKCRNQKIIDCDIFEEESSAKKRIIIILESPHIDEYYFKHLAKQPITLSTFQPIIPANGTAGDNIKSLLNLLSNLTSDFDVVLINRIQFQTSLGSFLNYKDLSEKKVENIIRDKVFKLLWETEGVEDDFWQRLTSFLNPNIDNIVINSSTKATDPDGGFHKNLESKYTRNSNISVLRYSHPSKWGIKIMK